jgi:hypothetical protein
MSNKRHAGRESQDVGLACKIIHSAVTTYAEERYEKTRSKLVPAARRRRAQLTLDVGASLQLQQPVGLQGTRRRTDR